MPMAIYEGSLLLAFLVRHYEFALPDPARKFNYKPGITMSLDGGLDLLVRRRRL